MSAVGIDLDGVCYDFADSLRTFLEGTHRKYPNPTRWEFYEDWGYSLEEFLDLCHDGVNAGVIFSHGDPFPGVRDALLRLRDAGHTLHVVTDRSFGKGGASEAATRVWLDTHQIPFDSLTFSADKTIVRTDYMIDDKLANYDALHAVGCNVFLLDRPWNQSRTPRDRVTSVSEFADVVLSDD